MDRDKAPSQQGLANDWFDEIISSPLQLSLDQLLSLVPVFREKLLRKLLGNHAELEIRSIPSISANSIDPADVDFVVPVIQVQYNQRRFAEVLLDGGSGVNILPEHIFIEMGRGVLAPTPFQVKMADQTRVQPVGILKQQQIIISGMTFMVNFVVIRMSESAYPYEMLLGRPWFRLAKVKQDWGLNVVMITKGKKQLTIPMHRRKNMSVQEKPLMAQTINLADEIEDDEEEKFLQANPTVVPVLEVDVAGVLSKEHTGGLNAEGPVPGEQVEGAQLQKIFDQRMDIPVQQQMEQQEKEIVTVAERMYDHKYAGSMRVKEEELQEVNLGTEVEPKMVWIGKTLEGKFKEDLICLLIEYVDVFAWDYTQVKGIDPQLHQHRINLKTDAVPVA
ncbi:hypothetical protein KP509_12G061500 [Ceratopteris richardii]|nr:hypothetical protein KP509_12G061500 [Ceratopteris richardii]